MRMKGLLISFDGVDSSGKETQTKQLADRLRYNGYTVRLFVTPDYNTPSGQEIKQWLQGKRGDWSALHWEEKMRLFSRNRAENHDEVVAALKAGDIVMYDRYVPSSLAFITVEALPAQETDLFRERIYRTVEHEEYEIKKMPREDASIFLDVPPHVSAELLEKRKEKLADEDEYTDHLQVQERLYNEYDVMCNNDPKRFVRIHCVSGTELLSIDDTSELVWEALTAKFPFLKTKRAAHQAS